MTRSHLLATALLVTVFCPAAHAGEKMRLGTLDHSLGFLHLDVAESLGWFRRPDLEVEVVRFKAGKDCAQALLAGDLDAAVLGTEHTITGQLEGKPVRQVVLLNRIPGWTLVVAKGKTDRFRSPADLKGAALGVTAPGSATDILLTYLLSRNGVGRTDVRIVRAGIGTLPDMLKQGGIDGGMALEPFGSELIADGSATVLVDFRSTADVRKHLGRLYPMTSLLVRQSVIDSRPQAVQSLTTTMVWACKWVHAADADRVIATLPPEYLPEPDVWRRSYVGYRDVFSPDGRLDPDGLKAVVEAQAAFGALPKQQSIRIEDLYTDRFWAVADPVPLPADGPTAAPTTDDPRGTGRIVFYALIAGAVVAALVLVFRPRRSGTR